MKKITVREQLRWEAENIDPYEAIGSPLRVHQPEQPKTQRERWEDEIEENRKEILLCGCYKVDSQTPTDYTYPCKKQGSDNCNRRQEKIWELEISVEKDHEKNKRYLNRHQTGEFADDHINQPTKMVWSLEEILIIVLLLSALVFTFYQHINN